MIILAERTATNGDDVRLVQYELRCPSCGHEWVWNAYDGGAASVPDYCTACEEVCDATPVTSGASWLALPKADG